jgi:microcystin-dependent protein
MDPFHPFYGHLPIMPTGVPVGAVIAFAGKISRPLQHPLKLPVQDQPVNSTIIESQGWMICDGQALNIADYGMLYAVLGATYNRKNDPDTVFRIPDYRGYFLRMVDMASGNDPDIGTRVLPDTSVSTDVGSIEQDAVQYHLHPYTQPEAAITVTIADQGSVNVVPAIKANINSGEAVTDPGKTPPPPENKPSQPSADYSEIKLSFETRPKNVSVYYIIKFT